MTLRIEENDMQSVAPFEWDGQTRYSDSGPVRQTYELKCGMCGRAAGEDRLLILEEANTITRLPRCAVCGGWTTLDPIPFSSLRSSEFRPNEQPGKLPFIGVRRCVS